MMNDPVEALFAEAARAAHPVNGPLNVVLNRIAALERKVEFLSRRVALLAELTSDPAKK